MNWIEIDKILRGIISRHDAVEDMLKEAKAQFKWNDRQTETALLPLLKNNRSKTIITEIPKKRSKRSTKRK
tara:strand:- start:755 stop:967 length:213 start_codon:yes stop_codon:yes gene_type:complete